MDAHPAVRWLPRVAGSSGGVRRSGGARSPLLGSRRGGHCSHRGRRAAVVEDATATGEAEDLCLCLHQGVATPDDLRVLQPHAACRAGEVGGGRGARRAKSPPPAVASISAASVARAASSRRWRGRGQRRC
jgi:hypothetical protein